MIRTTISALALAATIGTGALAADIPAVSEVTVYTSEEAVANGNAMKFWPEIDKDLQATIASRFGERLDAVGYKLNVNITDIQVDGSPMLADDGFFNQLYGQVTVNRQDDQNFMTNFSIALNAIEGQAPAGVVVVSPSDAEFYTALLAGFADLVLEDLQTLPDYEQNVTK